MTSKGDSLKTNDFLRLRKLRLQQVREQSKDIAKKIRQRAKVEQLRHVTNIDKSKEKEYLLRQEKLVNRLEQLCSLSKQNVGAGHKNACEVNEREIPEQIDLSKLRGKEAAAILKKKKQEKLDQQKKLLDRKLQAREIANVLSREKFAVVANNLVKSSSGKNISNDLHDKVSNFNENVVSDHVETHKDKSDPITKNDMGTQWEFEEIPNEWEPNIPTIPIPHDDSLKNSPDDNVERPDQVLKTRKLNLFALSDEMPSSLRGGITSIQDERLPIKPSLTLVSEYLQNRGLRLREPDTASFQKRKTDDLQSIKETLLRTRASKTDGSVFPNICHVLDEQVIPVPCWKAEKNCEFCSNVKGHLSQCHKNGTNNSSCLLKPGCQYYTNSYEKPKLYQKYHKYHHGLKIPVSGRSNIVERSTNSDDTNRPNKKNSVTMYDHITRDTRDLPQNIDKLVVRDQSNNDDAYSQALKEASVVDDNGRSHHALQQELRNKLAMTRENVDKEYRDTLAFLNSLPKEKPGRIIRTAYMDGDREKELKDKHQRKLEEEFKKIEKQNSKYHCKHARNKLAAREQNRRKSKSPVDTDMDNNIVNKNFKYSWLPIPEGDGSMAIHTIPNTIKDKSGNTVKFSSVDTYHEYRSRHKHTPPTKDIGNELNKRVVDAVIIQENSNNSMDASSDTDTSSVENLQVGEDNMHSHKLNKDTRLADAERIIIYKVMESKKSKKHKTKKKSQDVKHVDDTNNTENMHQNAQDVISENVKDNIKTNMNHSYTQVKEGIYKSVSANGDNITSLYFSDDQNEERSTQNENNKLSEKDDNEKDEDLVRKQKSCNKCKSVNTHEFTDTRPSAATSTSSFKTAVNEKNNNVLSEGGYIKFVDEGGKDTGKFYVGASGFLKDDAYEVIIQLRKKEVEKIGKDVSQAKNNIELTNQSQALQTNFDINQERQSVAFQSKNEVNITPNKLSETEKHESPPKDKSDFSLTRKDKSASIEAINTDTSKQEKSIGEPPKVNEKGTSTTFCDEFAIPDDMPKLDQISRPVTSIYTQTSHNSSIPRPVLMHLSSSTSTTYMSPPELILPRYLRKDNSESCDDTYEPASSNLNSQNMRFTSCKACRCGKCKKRKKGFKADTPPNTTRSTDQITDNLASEEQGEKKPGSERRHKNVNSHKCKNRSESKICSKQKFKRSQSDYKRFHSGNNYSTLSNKKSGLLGNFDKVNVNPVIETYVKKLLDLNKEGLKAIEVINQECSIVNTPGSSVIDVPSNAKNNKNTLSNKISLEQIMNSFEEQILNNIGNRRIISKSTGSQTEKNIKLLFKCNKKRPVHKVKSFNISKQMMKTNKENKRQSVHSTVTSTSPCSNNLKREKAIHTFANTENCNNSQSLNSPTPRQNNQEISNNTSYSNTSRDCREKFQNKNIPRTSKTATKICTSNKYQSKAEMSGKSGSYSIPSHKITRRSSSSESKSPNVARNHRNVSTPPVSISTQTNQVDSEVEFMKLAENKLQNMEKIADLTEKCTKRLSNLAKVLEEVRRNKSLVYSQISTSDCTSDSDQRSDKNIQASNNRTKTFNTNVEIQTLTGALSSMITSPQQKTHDVNNVSIYSGTYVPLLMDLPKPDTLKTPSPLSSSTETNNKDDHIVSEQQLVKNRAKPPPALTRINLKHVPEGFVIPHELSTVVEVDSPMSIKFKSHATQIHDKHEATDAETIDNISLNKIQDCVVLDTRNNPVQPNSSINKCNISKTKQETQSTEISEDLKMKMMDLKYFNEIMLKPFISLRDYAKQYNSEELDAQTSLNGISKDENVNDELSSLHSETSIPDVMAELLRRNLISEPFKFETTSNVNSTTVSSESTLSLLALSRARKEKKKTAMLVKNKENIGETSVSLSISSNPDLEHAFQRLGMGWASSTLKKTKERLALSSSSNTSSSSIPQFKIKSFSYQDVPEISSLFNISNKEESLKPHVGNLREAPKNALQQTSLTNSMTVKEFLTNELANKITFSNKSNRNTTEDEFVSLCETKIPEDLKHLSQKTELKEKSVDSPPSGSNNRARTSTPVQIFKSMTYHSTSSSNTSNGLFSNADELSSVKGTSNSIKNHSTSEKDDLTIPNYSLKVRKEITECSKSD